MPRTYSIWNANRGPYALGVNIPVVARANLGTTEERRVLGGRSEGDPEFGVEWSRENTSKVCLRLFFDGGLGVLESNLVSHEAVHVSKSSVDISTPEL